MKSPLVVLLLLLFTVSACAHETQVDTQEQISVLGVGEVEAQPDQAVLSISITAIEDSLADAKRVADQRYSKSLAVIKKQGIEDKYVKATQILAQPEYEWSNSKRLYKGERVSRTLNITINNLSKLSALMHGLVENDVSSINGVTTGFQDKSKFFEQAMAAAAENAKNKAQFLTQQFGRKLGPAFRITEQNTSAPQQHRAEMRAMYMDAPSASPPEMFGTQKIRAQVSASFRLL